jgi:hypothetical protein
MSPGHCCFARSRFGYGKRADSRCRRLPGHIIPRLTCPVALMEQPHAGPWLWRGKVACFQDGAVGRLQLKHTCRQRRLRLLRGRRARAAVGALSPGDHAKDLYRQPCEDSRASFTRVTLLNLFDSFEPKKLTGCPGFAFFLTPDLALIGRPLPLNHLHLGASTPEPAGTGVYTAHSDPSIERAVRSAGASAVISKSAAVAVLMSEARILLDQIAAGPTLWVKFNKGGLLFRPSQAG